MISEECVKSGNLDVEGLGTRTLELKSVSQPVSVTVMKVWKKDSMPVRVDPENNETRALLALVDFSGKRVLEVGCGDGRLMWRYAGTADHVVAIDPKADAIRRARENLPKELKSRVEFHQLAFEDFFTISKPSSFDSIIFAWSF